MRNALLCFLSMVVISSARAQVPAVNTPDHERFAIRLNVGYSFAHAGNLYNANGFTSWPISGTETFNTTTGVRTIDFNKASYGSGVGLTVGATYMFNPHVGVDLGVGVGLAPKKYTSVYTETYPSGIITNTVTTRQKMPILVAPSIVLSTGTASPFNAYTRLGVALPIGGNVLEEYMRENDILDIDDLTDEEYDFFMSKGLIGTLGIGYKISPALRVNMELAGTSLTRYVKSSEVTKATINGTDDLASWTVEQKQTEYHSSYT